MPKSKATHVVINSVKSGWEIRQSGSQRSSGHFDRIKDAADLGRKISRIKETELVIHNRNGRFPQKIVTEMIHIHQRRNSCSEV